MRGNRASMGDDMSGRTKGKAATAEQKTTRRFRVRYARIVLMETTVEATSEEGVKDDGLPGVFDGIPEEMVGKHVLDIQDYEFTWEVREADGPSEERSRRGRQSPGRTERVTAKREAAECTR